MVAVATGVIVMAVAFFLLVVHLSSVSGGTDTDTRPPVTVPVSSGTLIGGPKDVSVQTASYESGQSSGWHLHTGMHAVMVLSGTLSVYGSDCQSTTYGPGDVFVGGRAVHLVRNEANVRLGMAVTYMFPDGVSHTSFHIPSPAPANCNVG